MTDRYESKTGLLVLLACVAMLGCGSSGGDLPAVSGNDLSGDWVRVGEPDCRGEIPLQYLPLDQEFMHSEWLRVEQHDDALTIYVDGMRLLDNGQGVLQDGGVIMFEYDYGIVVDYVPGSVPPEAYRYDQITVRREAHLDDAMHIVFEDMYTSGGGSELFCIHLFEESTNLSNDASTRVSASSSFWLG